MTNLRGMLVLFPLVAMSINLSTLGQSPENSSALGVARLSLVKGEVTVQRGQSGDLIQATANMPLVEADVVTTGIASRAEVQLDYSNFLRLNNSSSVRLANLGHRNFRIQLEHGILTYSELRGGNADVDIETPLAAVRPEKTGSYRVEVLSLDKVTITVRKGWAEIASENGTETLKAGQQIIVRKKNNHIEFRVAKANHKDNWDLWSFRRDRQLMKSNAYSYVNSSIYGAENLDDYGDWIYVSSYGRCWFPAVTVGWAPYRYGRWSWLEYYGWTWLSHDPWGWAPYHYGRWFRHSRHGWGWHPGSFHSRHYWKPALVAFFGYDRRGGLRVNLGSKFGYYGWIALAPGEPYYPWYGRRSHRRKKLNTSPSNVLVNNRINIYNNYRNAGYRNGTTLVSARHFSRGKTLNTRSLQAREMRKTHLMRGWLPVVPERISQGQLIDRTDRFNRGRDSINQPRFFSTGRSRRNITRRSFVQQRQEITQFVNSQSRSNVKTIRPATPTTSTRTPSRHSSPRSRLQKPTQRKSTFRHTNRQSLPSPSRPSVSPRRINVDQSSRERVNSPSPPTVHGVGETRTGSPRKWRRFDRPQGTRRTVMGQTPSRNSILRTTKSIYASPPSAPLMSPKPPPPRFVPRKSSRVKSNRGYRSSTSPPVALPSSSLQGRGEIIASPSPRHAAPRTKGDNTRARSRSSNRSSTRTRAPSFSQYSVPRSPLRFRNFPSNNQPSRSVSRPSSRSYSKPSSRRPPRSVSANRRSQSQNLTTSPMRSQSKRR